MNKYDIYKFLYYYGVGSGFGSALKNHSSTMLFLTLVGMFIGLCILFPIFISEDNSDKKL